MGKFDTKCGRGGCFRSRRPMNEMDEEEVLDNVDDLIYAQSKIDKANRIDRRKESTPEKLASASWLGTLVYNTQKRLYVDSPDKIVDVAKPRIPIEDWIEINEDWVADRMEKHEVESDTLEGMYEELMRDYVFEVVNKAFPNGFDYVLDETISDIAFAKVKKALGLWNSQS